MPYRRPSGRRTSAIQGYSMRSNQNRSNNYTSEQSGIRRHDRAITQSGSDVTGVYKVIDLCRFTRTFDPGSTSDDEPTASAGNNYASGRVMNGSKVVDFRANFTVSNNSTSVGCYIDVYTIALAFWDGLIWKSIQDATCPIAFSETGGVGSTKGEVTTKTPAAGLITAQNYRDFKHIQHYMKHLGTIYLTPDDGGSSATSFSLNGLPAKCRRSQTGMFYNLFFVNDTIKNSSVSIDYKVVSDISFKEIPSVNRLPYIQ